MPPRYPTAPPAPPPSALIQRARATIGQPPRREDCDGEERGEDYEKDRCAPGGQQGRHGQRREDRRDADDPRGPYAAGRTQGGRVGLRSDRIEGAPRAEV